MNIFPESFFIILLLQPKSKHFFNFILFLLHILLSALIFKGFRYIAPVTFFPSQKRRIPIQVVFICPPSLQKIIPSDSVRNAGDEIHSAFTHVLYIIKVHHQLLHHPIEAFPGNNRHNVLYFSPEDVLLMLNSHDMEHALNLFDEFNFIHLYLAVSLFRYNLDSRESTLV